MTNASADSRIRVAIIGCGNIAGPYARDLAAAPEIELAGVADLDQSRAAKLAAEVGCAAYPSVEALLADSSVDIAINLTIQSAHAAVSTACLEAGKSVYSEKPLAMTHAEAQALVALADARGLRLACSPFTSMGEAQQTAWQWLRAGRLGRVRVAYAEVNWGRIETWHPDPEAFYAVGPLFDVGPYPLAILTSLLGPARRVWAHGAVLYPDRTTLQGKPFAVDTPDFVMAAIELAGGTLVRLTTNFYVSQQTRQQGGIEFHGDNGSLFLDSWVSPGSMLQYAEFGKNYQRVRLGKPALFGVRWGTGVREMASAIRENRPHRNSGQQAAHLVEIMCAIHESVRTGQPVSIESDFPAPEPMPWA